MKATLLFAVLLTAMVSCIIFKMQPQPPGFFGNSKQTTLREALRPSMADSVKAMMIEPEHRYGMVRMLFAKSSCNPDPSIPLPYIIPQDRIPKINEEWKALFVTCVCSSPPEPDNHFWLILSVRAPDSWLPAELSPLGMPGCMLQVNPDLLIHCPPFGANLDGSAADTVASGAPTLVRQLGRGQAMFAWTPPAAAAGQTVWMQLLVSMPGHSPSGFLLSHAISLQIGS